jgi:hypothetical protein
MTNEAREEAIENLKLVSDNIENFGCHLTLIEADNYMPAFVYSIGLFKKFGHPEIICFGLNIDVMASIINHACDLIKNGEILITDKSYRGFLEGFPIQFIYVNKEYYQNYVGYAGLFYNQTFFHGKETLTLTGNSNNHCLTETQTSNFMKKEI